MTSFKKTFPNHFSILALGHPGSPHYAKDRLKELLEKVKKTFTRMFTELKGKYYYKRLQISEFTDVGREKE